MPSVGWRIWHMMAQSTVWSKFDFDCILNTTRLGGLLDFGQLFKAFGKNQFAQMSQILREFL